MRQRGSTRLNTILILLMIALLATVVVPTWQAHYGFGDYVPETDHSAWIRFA